MGGHSPSGDTKVGLMLGGWGLVGWGGGTLTLQ